MLIYISFLVYDFAVLDHTQGQRHCNFNLRVCVCVCVCVCEWTLVQGCTNHWCQVTRATELGYVAPKICEPSVWNLLRVILLMLRVLRRLLWGHSIRSCNAVKYIIFYSSFKYLFVACHRLRNTALTYGRFPQSRKVYWPLPYTLLRIKENSRKRVDNYPSSSSCYWKCRYVFIFCLTFRHRASSI